MNIPMQEIVLISGFILTVGGLIWQMAKLHGQSNNNKESIIKAHSRIDKLEDNTNNKFNELSEQLRSVSENQIRMETKINLLLEKK